MILITGGTGVMGKGLVKRLRAKGHDVRVLALPGDPGLEAVRGLGAQVREGDVADSKSIAGICEGVHTVCHLAAVIIAFDDSVYERVNIGGTVNVLGEAVRAGVKRFVHVSSASVVYPRSTAYSRSKLQTERLVKESGLAWTIVRPTLVYDVVGGQEFDQFLEYLRRFPVVPFIGRGTAIKRPVFARDVVDGIAAVIDATGVEGKTYNLSGPQRVTMYVFSRMCLSLMGVSRKAIVPIPVGVCSAISRLMGLVMKRPPLRWPVIAGVIQDADLDPADAIRDLGYSPVSVDEQLPRCFPRVDKVGSKRK